MAKHSCRWSQSSLWTWYDDCIKVESKVILPLGGYFYVFVFNFPEQLALWWYQLITLKAGKSGKKNKELYFTHNTLRIWFMHSKDSVKLRYVHRKKSALDKLYPFIQSIYYETLLYSGRECYRHLII